MLWKEDKQKLEKKNIKETSYFIFDSHLELLMTTLSSRKPLYINEDSKPKQSIS